MTDLPGRTPTYSPGGGGVGHAPGCTEPGDHHVCKPGRSTTSTTWPCADCDGTLMKREGGAWRHFGPADCPTGADVRTMSPPARIPTDPGASERSPS